MVSYCRENVRFSAIRIHPFIGVRREHSLAAFGSLLRVHSTTQYCTVLTSRPRSRRPWIVTSLASSHSGSICTTRGDFGTCSSLYLTLILYSPAHITTHQKTSFGFPEPHAEFDRSSARFDSFGRLSGISPILADVGTRPSSSLHARTVFADTGVTTMVRGAGS
jgi:hypothetical protein